MKRHDDFKDFMDGFYKYYEEESRMHHFRIGQAFMMYLSRQWHEMYAKIAMNYSIDCFYDNDLLPKTIETVQSNWSTRQKSHNTDENDEELTRILNK